ncbi:helicase C-terminal domain-containing protein [Bacillus marasmi]|uniref:helicase C-terminal domain-containing protein n=1 Tax=Bacillus marasmi TaxID=1926279 RepID=UPI001FE77B18|nr:helicase-related protein [Bacillus marasmi]
MKTHSANYRVDTYKTFKSKIKGGKDKGIALRSHFAVGFYKDEGENQKGTDRKESIRNSFNSPFRPFVLATTSIGQEGLDFHFYCRKIMHWNLPSNPIDLEQREGRINRFKCLAIRQNIALKFGEQISFEKDIWEELFDFAKQTYSGRYSELIPFWCLPDDQEIKIERIVPLYPMSKDIGSYQRLIKILSLYRITLGQARQEELLEYLLENSDSSEDLKDLFIILSPYYRENSTIIL